METIMILCTFAAEILKREDAHCVRPGSYTLRVLG